RVLKPSAAETVVLPTPPLPKTSDRGTSSAGQVVRSRRTARLRGDGTSYFRRVPAKTCSANEARAAGPMIGPPGSSPRYLGVAGKCVSRNFRACCSEAEAPAQALQRRPVMTRFRTIWAIFKGGDWFASDSVHRRDSFKENFSAVVTRTSSPSRLVAF